MLYLYSGMLQYGRVQQRRPLLPSERQDELCRGGAVSTDCFKSGDGRVNEHPGLVAAHIVWLRQHNRFFTPHIYRSISSSLYFRKIYYKRPIASVAHWFRISVSACRPESHEVDWSLPLSTTRPVRFQELKYTCVDILLESTRPRYIHPP